MLNAKNPSDPDTCPFRGGELSGPGGGFVDSTDENDGRKTDFDGWRTNFAGDRTDEWSE